MRGGDKMTEDLHYFSRAELCLLGMGEKWHIRRPGMLKSYSLSHCGGGPIEDVTRSVITVREDYERICKNCLREWRKNK